MRIWLLLTTLRSLVKKISYDFHEVNIYPVPYLGDKYDV
jgi:hypothetical protein